MNRIPLAPAGKRPERRARSDAGFSLTELLVVLAIMALLAGFVGPKVVGYFARAKSQTAASQIEGLRAALDLYLLDVGRYPSTEEGLGALVEAPPRGRGWQGPYLQDTVVPPDPWGNPYVYEARGSARPLVISHGADGATGGEGDAADIGG
ncbi:MAG: type II secretion system major pseudopilin GspG [Paracoccaceae bacterium]